MAKKKRRVSEKQEEEYEFVPPEFDEKEFILKDIYNTKVFLVVAILAVVVGLASALIYGMGDSWHLVGLLLMVVVIIGMKEFLKILRFDPDLLEAKSMFGNYLLFFLLSLGVWIIFINSPFA